MVGELGPELLVDKYGNLNHGLRKDLDKRENFVKRLNINDFREEHISIQKTKIITEDEVYTFSSLNEITIRAKDFNVLKMDVFIDNSLLEHFTGDGILASTATGSTAYNMSFGGSIVYNSLNTLLNSSPMSLNFSSN